MEGRDLHERRGDGDLLVAGWKGWCTERSAHGYSSDVSRGVIDADVTEPDFELANGHHSMSGEYDIILGNTGLGIERLCGQCANVFGSSDEASKLGAAGQQSDGLSSIGAMWSLDDRSIGGPCIGRK